jgi:hypothetical protein
VAQAALLHLLLGLQKMLVAMVELVSLSQEITVAVVVVLVAHLVRVRLAETGLQQQTEVAAVAALQMVVVLVAQAQLRLVVLVAVLLVELAVLELRLYFKLHQVQMVGVVVAALRHLHSRLKVQFFLLKTAFIT